MAGRARELSMLPPSIGQSSHYAWACHWCQPVLFRLSVSVSLKLLALCVSFGFPLPHFLYFFMACQGPSMEHCYLATIFWPPFLCSTNMTSRSLHFPSPLNRFLLNFSGISKYILTVATVVACQLKLSTEMIIAIVIFMTGVISICPLSIDPSAWHNIHIKIARRCCCSCCSPSYLTPDKQPIRRPATLIADASSIWRPSFQLFNKSLNPIHKNS